MKLSTPAREIAAELESPPFPGIALYTQSITDQRQMTELESTLHDWYEWFSSLPIETQNRVYDQGESTWANYCNDLNRMWFKGHVWPKKRVVYAL